MTLQFLKFALVGGVATATHVLAALILFYISGLGAFSANLMGFVSAWLVSYGGNRYWTFVASGPHRVTAPKFLLVSIVGLLLNMAIIYLACDVMNLPFWLGLAIVVAVVPILQFAASRYWVFVGFGSPEAGR